MDLFVKLNTNQRFVVYLTAICFSLVLFNTTYLGLGTIVPIFVYSIVILYSCFNRYIVNRTFTPFIIYALIITLLTLLFDGKVRDLSKIVILVGVSYSISNLKFNFSEVKFLSLMLCITYCFYAILVIQSIGINHGLYGRVQIKILNGDIPLDPNVISATFILPIIIALYNLVYGKYKLLAVIIVLLFVMALLATGSRGAFITLLISSSFFILRYLFEQKRKQSMLVKLSIIFILCVGIFYVLNFISIQEGVMGMDRLTDYSDGNNGRTKIWLNKLSLILDSPLFGYGVTHYATLDASVHACHNTFLEALFYGGIVGFIFFIAPLIRLFNRKTMPFYLKTVLFVTVCLPICSIDTLQERTLWNFLIFYEILSRFQNAEEGLLWNS